MATGSRRTEEQIREEIRQERTRLDDGVAALAAGARRSGRVAASATAAVAAVVLLRRLRAFRR